MPEYQFVDITNMNILKRLLTSDCKTVESSEVPFPSLKTSLLVLKFQLPSIKFSKFWANRVLPLPFRCNFFIPRWFSFKFSLSINPIFFCLQKFWSLEFVLARHFSKLFLSFRIIILEKDIAVLGDFFLVLLTFFFNIVQKNHIVCEVVSTYVSN